MIKVSTIKKNPNNPRQIKGEKLELLKQSITDFEKMMALRPMVVDETNTVLGGNMRLAAIKALGMKEIPDEWIKRADDLTPDEKARFTISDNAGFGEWDWDQIANEWTDYPLEAWGLDVPDFEAIDPAEPSDAEPQMDKAAELNKKWKVKSGDLWQIGRHRLVCGDSTDAECVSRLMGGERAQMVFTSPPYNANSTLDDYTLVDGKLRRNNNTLYADNSIDNKSSEEFISFCHDILTTCFSVTDGYIFWNIGYNAKSRYEYLDAIYPFRDRLQETIAWKKNALPIANGFTRNFEFIFLFKTNPELGHITEEYDTTHTVWEVNNAGSQQENHKACFPVDLPSKAIQLSKRTQLLFEPFAGSGTTLVACENLNRKCYAIEISENYCAVILERMSDAFPSIEIKRLQTSEAANG